MLNFMWKIKESFKNVKKDVDSFKGNVNEWVVFLDAKNNDLEKKLDKLEARMERLEEAMFRILSLRE